MNFICYASCHSLSARALRLLWLIVLCVVYAGGAALAGPVDPPSPELVDEARTLVREMKQNPRGPYSRILWYCKDGMTFPPVPYACREHGGGIQHAEYSANRQRLAELGWSVGTIFAGSDFQEFFESRPRQQRLRELAMERYLMDIDDGWVLRRAHYYRGRVQLEDEVAAGRELLIRALTDWDWAKDNYLLIRELVRVVPHGEETDLSRHIRRAAVDLAEKDPAAESWRAEIHSSPTVATARKLRAWAETLTNVDTRVAALELADELDLLYGVVGRHQRLTEDLAVLQSPELLRDWRDDVMQYIVEDRQARIAGLCLALRDARLSLLEHLEPGQRLALIDSLDGLETEVRVTFRAVIDDRPWTREELLVLTDSLMDCAYGSGLLSTGELAAIESALAYEGQEIPLQRYQQGLNQLKRVPAWAAGNIRYAFAEPLVRYAALDPRASRFTDDMLRGSPVWMLGDTLRLLSKDLGELTGSEVELQGKIISTGIALNQGLARGRLRIFETLEAAEAGQPQPTDIVVLPETIAELKPVAGILTLGEGNALSHVQLLARNFGIPNVAIDQESVDLIRPLEGRDVVLIVGPNGNVIFRAAEDVEGVAKLFGSTGQGPATGQLTVPPPNLELTQVLHLKDIHRELSGKVVGPKAANLGQLNRMFSGRVAPAIAIPFGVYAQQLEDTGLMPRIRAAYAASAKGEFSKEELEAQLAEIRNEIANLRLGDAVRSQLVQAMGEEFGGLEGYGVFVRSDTNVEDLPEFTGAGLSETVPNVVGLDAQLATVPRVWSSVLSPRALAWRSSLLSNPEQVYASVLVMKSVPSDKSGVLVIANLIDPLEAGLTASTAWGVGGAVAGEAAESLTILPESTRLVSEAKAPYRRQLSASGGIDWMPAAPGRVLEDAEIEQLRSLALEVVEKYVPVLDDTGKPRPWDIEFGFVSGELTLFQIRPLVEKSGRRAEKAMRKLRPASAAGTGDAPPVDLSVVISGAMQ